MSDYHYHGTPMGGKLRGRELDESSAVDVEGRGWYCDNCAERYSDE